MNNPKNIQIPFETYRDIVNLIFALENVKLEPDVQEIKNRVEKAIYAKTDAVERRQKYSENLKNRK